MHTRPGLVTILRYDLQLPIYFTLNLTAANSSKLTPHLFHQVQGLTEHFRDPCGGEVAWIDSETYYTAFTEGWALYAENPLIAQDTDTYKDPETFFQKYGMLKWQVGAASRCSLILSCVFS